MGRESGKNQPIESPFFFFFFLFRLLAFLDPSASALTECGRVDVYGIGVGTMKKSDMNDLEYFKDPHFRGWDSRHNVEAERTLLRRGGGGAKLNHSVSVDPWLVERRLVSKSLKK